MAHAHRHDQQASGHTHNHATADFGRAFAIGVSLNLGFVILEAGYGLISGSMALLSDAGHNFSDVIGLLVAWGAAGLSKVSPTKRFTYGLKGSSILAALANAVLLLVAVGAIIYGAIHRLFEPEPVESAGIMIVAGIGIVINTATALLFARGRKSDLNIHGAYLHMAADAAVSAAVVLAGALIWWTGRDWIDPLTSLLIALVVLWGTWGLLRDSVVMSLAAVPANIALDEVDVFLQTLAGVERVHDLHIWHISTTETALTAHLVMPTGHPGDAFLAGASRQLLDTFGISHCTFQVETSVVTNCKLESSESG